MEVRPHCPASRAACVPSVLAPCTPPRTELLHTSHHLTPSQLQSGARLLPHAPASGSAPPITIAPTGPRESDAPPTPVPSRRGRVQRSPQYQAAHRHDCENVVHQDVRASAKPEARGTKARSGWGPGCATCRAVVINHCDNIAAGALYGPAWFMRNYSGLLPSRWSRSSFFRRCSSMACRMNSTSSNGGTSGRSTQPGGLRKTPSQSGSPGNTHPCGSRA